MQQHVNSVSSLLVLLPGDMTLSRFSIVLLCCIAVFTTAKAAGHSKEKCRGAFDVYFVLDSSSSLIKSGVNHFRRDTVTFVETLSNMFISPLMRMSYITFSGQAKVVMPLTGNRTVIQRKLRDLKSIYPTGPTLMHYGIQQATRQIMKTKDKRASIIIALTDGKLERGIKSSSVYQANQARKLGSTMFMVGVSEYDEQQLVEIAGGKRKFVFEATDFKQLTALADKILDSSCVEILSADPNMVCVNDSFDVRIYGRGFNRNGILSQTMCYFWADGRGVLKTPKQASDTFLLCESPDGFFVHDDKTITVQVSLNEGVSFISSNVTISAYNCTFSSSHLWISLIFLLLFALVGLWWMWNIITCKSPHKDKKNPTRPPPPPPPNPVKNEPKHWPSVDASFYGGAGAGGIKPVPVKWGDKGCTEAASHLEKTKDAKEIVVNVKDSDENDNSIKSQEKSSLCGGFLSPFTKCYAWLEQRRPGS